MRRLPQYRPAGPKAPVEQRLRSLEDFMRLTAEASHVSAADGSDNTGSLPVGGDTAEVLRKVSATDFDTEWHALVKADVGLDQVDDTSDVNKPVSTAQQTALDGKVALAPAAGALQSISGPVAAPYVKSTRRLAHFVPSEYGALVADDQTRVEAMLTAALTADDYAHIDLEFSEWDMDAPIDVGALTGIDLTRTLHTIIGHGVFNYVGADQAPTTVAKTACATTQNNHTITVPNTTSLEIGMLIRVTGGDATSITPVGRETYLKTIVDSTHITTTVPANTTNASVNLDFIKYPFLLDFRKMETLSNLRIYDTIFWMNKLISGVTTGNSGFNWRVSRCVFDKPRDRGLVEMGGGDAIWVDFCRFIGGENSTAPPDRTRIGMSINRGDAKIRFNDVEMFHHGLVCHGDRLLYTGGHIWQGAGSSGSVNRSASIILTGRQFSTVTSAYIDNSWIEITNETSGTGNVGGLCIAGNTWIVSNSDANHRFIKVRPFGTGIDLNDLVVANNMFFPSDTIDRVEAIDTTNGSIDLTTANDVMFRDNVFAAVTYPVENPCTLKKTIAAGAESATWDFKFNDNMPFGLKPQIVRDVTPMRMKSAAAAVTADWPSVLLGTADSLTDDYRVRLTFAGTRRGTVSVTADANIGIDTA